MRVVVLGAGVVGVSSAYQLLSDGHEVVVIERNAEPAQETSFANAGLVCPGHAYAWASPQAPLTLLRSLYRRDQALRFKPQLDLAFWRWTLAFLGQCTAARARINTINKLRLASYSKEMLDEVVAATGVEYDRCTEGIVYIYRQPASFERGIEHIRILADNGLDLEILDRKRVTSLEPALRPVADKIAGAVFAPGDQSGDAYSFTQSLAGICRAQGAEFRFGTEALDLELEGGSVAAVGTNRGAVQGDAFVLALGCFSEPFARGLGVRLPIYPIKGYSMTAPRRDDGLAPRRPVVDEDRLVVISPLGKRFRITATAEFAGYDTSFRREDFDSMLRTAHDLFPSAADYAELTHWAGLRPMTPQGTPILGRGRLENLYFNTGHGSMGWTLACGSARVTADLIAGRKPAVALDGMTLT